MHLPTPDAIQVTLTLSTLGVIWIGWAKLVGPWIRRRWDRFIGFVEAIAGRDPIIDKASGIVKAPAVPPLGVRLASIDDTMQRLVGVIESNHDAHKRIDNLDGRVSAAEHDLDLLKTAAVERIVTKDESAQMWRAVANGDALPDED